MAALLVFGLVLALLALLPGSRRPFLLLVAAGLLCAAAARTATPDGFVVVAAGVLPLLAGLVAREIADTMRLTTQARRSEKRIAERRAAARRREYERRRDDLAA
jgi:hypothetical protein